MNNIDKQIDNQIYSFFKKSLVKLDKVSFD